MLLLGAVALFEPVNGYQIRRELVSWEVDRWAHVNPGSIYSGLATLTRLGQLERTDLVDGTREVAVYELTDAGREELRRLMQQALERVDLYDAVAFHAAFGLLPLMSRAEAVGHLRKRLEGLGEAVRQLTDVGAAPSPHAPPHAMAGLRLQRERAVVEQAWLGEVLADVERGALDFRGEPWTWEAPADDPGWQMHLDREKYRALLGR